MSFEIRHARPGDLQGILDILNYYILNHHCTFDTVPWRPEQKQDWFDAKMPDGPYQLLVAEADGAIAGYCFSDRWRPKKGYDITAESTIYIHPDHAGGGLGKALLGTLQDKLQGAGLKKLVAGIGLPNEASIRLHEGLGYRSVGTFHAVGTKFGKAWDVNWFEYDFSEP